MDDNVIFLKKSDHIIINYLYHVGGYYTYEVIISVNGYSGICDFCMSREDLDEYLKEIDTMSNDLSGKLVMNDSESDAYLIWYFEDKLNFYVSGQIGGSWQDNVLKFKMKADQTALYELRKCLLNFIGRI